MVTFNQKDNCYYGTNAERLAMTIPIATQKFYEYDTRNSYISDGTTWWLL